MSGELRLFNRQRLRPINQRHLRQMIGLLLTDLLHLDEFDLAVHLVNASEMARLNQTWLKHAGSTDVITLDYTAPVAENVSFSAHVARRSWKREFSAEVILERRRENAFNFRPWQERTISMASNNC